MSNEGGSTPGYNNTASRQWLVDTRINEGIGGYNIGDETNNQLTLISPQPLIPALSNIRFAMACMGVTGNYYMSMQLFFQKA
jgi:hypothetical protein